MNNHLEELIRTIIRDEYGFGDQNIDSEEIYDKLIQAGQEVPELAMADILKKLKENGLIKGAFYTNREAAHKHGAASIMWVSRYI